MNAITKTRAVGGSLIVTIPIEIVREEDLREDEVVEIQVKKKRKSYFGMFKGIGKFSEEDRMEDRG